MKKYIEELIQSQVDLYQKDSKRMISDFNSERQHVADYNGRQLLELLQNADDARADKVAVNLESKSHKLIISNTGQPFSELGYESLMLSNLSSKTEEQFIGNKGLGFRSIINWSEEIIVRSNGLDVKFSKEIAAIFFDETFDDDEKKDIRVKRNLSENAIPWAILATPEILVSDLNEWATEIHITYKPEFFDDIKKQIDSLQKESLLFLNHLSKLELTIDKSVNIFSKIKAETDIFIDDEQWKIYDIGNHPLPEQLQDKSKANIQHYNLRIALPKHPSISNYKLYSFFPTEIELDFPFIVHGTFDLDSSRNQLTDTPTNRFILEHLVDLIVDIAKKESEKYVNWYPLKLLSYSVSGKNPILTKLGFYELLDTAKSYLKIFPCIDETYRTFSEVRFKTNEFSQLLLDTEGKKWFSNIVKPIDSELFKQYCSKINNDIENIAERINNYSQHLLDYPIEYRVRIIKELTRAEWENGEDFNVLTNRENVLIDSNNEEAFTPLSYNIKELSLPDHVKIEFINIELYKRLIGEFSIVSDDKPRELQRILKKITRIQSYEPAQLISKIVSATNKSIKERPELSKEYVVGMVRSLYHIYTHLGEDSTFPKAVRPQLINKLGDLANSNEIYLGDDYPLGTVVESLFLKVYGKELFLSDRKDYGLENEGTDTVENFFVWLGVNKFIQYQEITRDPDYVVYLNTLNNLPTDYRDSSIKVLSIQKTNLDKIIKDFSLEEIVLWLYYDSLVKLRLLNYENKDQAMYSRYREANGSFKHSYSVIPSYISYQLKQYKLFDEYLITEDKALDFINPVRFDYSYFADKNISSRDINLLISKLGAKDNFEGLPIEQVNNILRTLPEKDKDPDGRQTQKLYKLALEHFKKNNIALDEDILLFAKKSLGQSGYFPQSEIYYSDNIRLPTKIIQNHPILNLPKRSGGKQVSTFFHVKNFNDMNVDVLSSEKIDHLSEQFDEKFSQLKPYLLAYRIENLQKTRDIEARAISSLKIIICKFVKCKYQDNEFELEDNDYVELDNSFLIKVNESQNLNSIIKDSGFSDAFSEIISLIFKVNEYKDEFRYILRNEDTDTEHMIRGGLGEEILFESRKLLGISDYFVSFWQGIFKTLSINFENEIKRENSSLIASELSLAVEDVLSLSNPNMEPESLHEYLNILKKMNIEVHEFNQNAFHKINLAEIHQNKITNIFIKHQQKFRYILWSQLHKTNDNEKKSKFIEIVGQYDHLTDWIDTKAKELNEIEITRIDYVKLVFDLIQEKFLINLYSETENECEVDYHEPDSIYKLNLQLSKLNNDTDIPENIRSFLFFSNCLELVNEYIETIKPKESDSNSNFNNSNNILKPLPKIPSETKAIVKPVGIKKASVSARFSLNQENRKRESGFKAETIVYHSLVNAYGKNNVDHVSLRDDTLGYDIRYSHDGNTWKFVEVKRYSNSLFYLSQHEMNFADGHKINYEVFLVDLDDNIFRLENIDFDDKERFSLEANGYVIHFELIH